jgi:hypothetical protein
MSHPTSRAERRHQRDRVIARRKFIVTRVWSRGSYSTSSESTKKWLEEMQWGVYAKFNLNCGCTQCHGAKYFSCAHKRRKALRHAESQADFRRKDKVEGR